MATSAGSRVSLVPGFLTDDPQWKRGVAAWMLEVNQGHLQNIGRVTLNANATDTTVTDARAGANSFIGFMPTTAAAAAELGGGTLYVATQGKQSFVVTHSNISATDRTYTYCILG